MKAFAAAVLLGLAIAACFVERPTDSFTCATDMDCTDNRTCMSGYCVAQQCPADCTSCDEATRSCTIECASGDSCGSVACANGWTCTINCIGAGACGAVTCDDSSKCTINCSGAGACGDISCRTACTCDLTCASGACDTITCPTAMGGNRCTTDGAMGSPCLSSPSGCTKC